MFHVCTRGLWTFSARPSRSIYGRSCYCCSPCGSIFRIAHHRVFWASYKKKKTPPHPWHRRHNHTCSLRCANMIRLVRVSGMLSHLHLSAPRRRLSAPAVDMCVYRSSMFMLTASHALDKNAENVFVSKEMKRAQIRVSSARGTGDTHCWIAFFLSSFLPFFLFPPK